MAEFGHDESTILAFVEFTGANVEQARNYLSVIINYGLLSNHHGRLISLGRLRMET